MTRMRIAVVIGMAALAAQALAQAPGPRDGRWEVTMQMDVPGLPFKPPAIKATQCITKEDAANAEKTVPKAQDKDCKATDTKVDGNKVTWTVKCEGKKPTTGTGEIVYAGDTYEGWTKMKSDDGEVTMTYTGKRLGDCTK